MAIHGHNVSNTTIIANNTTFEKVKIMKVCAIICEYNPFHNGHALQMRLAREQSGCDALLCIMSGGFVQRGEPAITDKWTRAACALDAGADLVLELPAVHALRPARDYARGAVKSLLATGVVTHLSFGIEDTSAAFMDALLCEETPEQQIRVAQALKLGQTYPRALAAAKDTLLPPNAILATEYLRALRELGSDIQPVPILREASHASNAMHALASSTAIRNALAHGETEALAEACPPAAAEKTAQALKRQGGAAEFTNVESALLYALRQSTPEQLTAYADVTEGLENRILQSAAQAGDLQTLLDGIKSKRYTMARIKRILLHILLGFTRETLSACEEPSYLRVLGFRKDAQPLLKRIKESSRLALITKAAAYKEHPAFQLDLRAQDLWALCLPDPHKRAAGGDFLHSPVLL